jgi:glycosyltransferase involved in cell wall biosynthesis
MKILAVVFCPPFGAIHDIFVQIVMDLSMKAQVSLLCPDNLQVVDNTGNNFEKIYKINYDKRNLLSLFSLHSYQIIKQLSTSDYDAIFFFSQHILNIPIAMLLKNTKQVMWWHEPNKKGRTTFLKYLLYIPHDYLLTKKSKRIIVSCDAMISMVPDHLRDKTAVIPFSSCLLNESLVTKQKDEIEQEKFDFLFFGKIEAYKGLSILAQSIEWLYDRGYQPTLNIIGMGDMAKHCPQLLKLAEDHPQEIIISNSFASEEIIIAAMQQSKIVVLPYLTATGTTTVQIAYEQSKPVIATQTGCFQNYIIDGKTGWLVPPSDFLALAGALKKVLDDPEKTYSMGESAYQYFMENFTRDIVTAKLMKIFSDCIMK